MPTYGYRCTECNYAFEENQKITADSLKTCPQCHKNTLRRGPGGGIGLAFKGSGFYITDYPKFSGDASSKGEAGSGGCACGKGSCSE